MGRFWRRYSAYAQSTGQEVAHSDPSSPQPDHAWKALSVTNEWIRHADAKSGVTLALAGVTATVLFNLANRDMTWTCALKVIAGLAAIAIVGAIVSAGFALVPRVKRQGRAGRAGAEGDRAGDSVNLLFFGDVHHEYAEDRPTYRQALTRLTSDVAELTGQIADQIHANARVATVKFQWANRAIAFELLAALALAATALLVSTGW